MSCIACLALPFRLLFNPSHWQAFIQSIHPQVSLEVGLLDLSWSQQRRLGCFWQVFFRGLVLLCLLVAAVLLLKGEETSVVWRGSLYALGAGLCGGLLGSVFSLLLGLLLGLWIALLAGLAAGLAPDAVWAQWLAMATGFSFGLAVSILLQVNQGVSGVRSNVWQEGLKLLAGLLLVVLLLLIGIYATRWLAAWWLPDVDGLYVWVAGLVVGAWLTVGLNGRQWRSSSVLALLLSIVLGLSAYGLRQAELASWYRPLVGAGFSILLPTLCFGLSYRLVQRLVTSKAALVAGLFSVVAAYYWLLPGGQAVLLWLLVALLLGLSQSFWRPLLFWLPELALAQFLQRRDELQATSPYALRWHPALWDTGQWLKLYGLDAHLLAVQQQDGATAQAFMARLATGHQAWAVQAVQQQLYLQAIQQVDRLEDIQALAVSLPHNIVAKETYWHRFQAVSQHLNRTDASVLEALRSAAMMLEGLHNELNTVRSDLADDAAHWQSILANNIAQLEQQPLRSPYNVGGGLIADLFVGRSAIVNKLEQLFELPQAPGLLIYGQRRIGKTWLSGKLKDLLPAHYVAVNIDFQSCNFESHAALLYRFSSSIRQAAEAQVLQLPPLTREALQAEPFLVFQEWLEKLEKQHECTWLLLFDEFEYLNTLFEKQKLDADAVLSWLRHLIQHHPKLRVILIGAHLLSEYPDWQTYLVNLQSLRLSYLSPNETRALINKSNQTGLRYDEPAIQHLFKLAYGHPVWVQALCDSIIQYKNAQPTQQRLWVTEADVEVASPRLPESYLGLNVVYQECSAAQQVLLQQLANAPDGLCLDKRTVGLQQLVQLDIVLEKSAECYWIPVELWRRWLLALQEFVLE